MEILKQIDHLIRQGRQTQARSLLLDLIRNHRNKVERKNWALVGRLLRRIGDPLAAIGFLGPAIYPSPRKPLLATPAERAEYAASMSLIGGFEEAKSILDVTPVEQAPEVLLFQGFNWISIWNYEKAMEPLRRYSERPDTPEYDRLVGLVNLAAAMVDQRKYFEATDLLNFLRCSLQKSENTMLLMTVFLLAGENEINRGNFPEAKEHLEKANSISQYVLSRDSIFVKKWTLIARLLECGPGLDLLVEFSALKKAAWKQGDFETCRDLDLYLGIHASDVDALKRVYFGTPYTAYIQKLENFNFPMCFDLWKQDFRDSSAPNRSIDVFGATSLDSKFIVKPGGVLHRLLIALCSDFYRPVRIGYLYRFLYPKNRFNLKSAPNQIYQAMHRLKALSQKTGYSLNIRTSRYGSQLEPSDNFSLRVDKSMLNLIQSDNPGLSWQIEKMMGIFGCFKPFTRANLGAALNIPDRTAGEILLEAKQRNIIEVRGAGPNTSYILKQSK